MRVLLAGFLIIAALLCSCNSSQKASEKELSRSIIPKPTQVRFSTGHFVLNNSTQILTDDDLQNEIKIFSDLLNDKLDIQIASQSKADSENAIRLLLSDDNMGPEGYHIDISEQSINIKINEPIGALHAFYTVLQLALLNRNEGSAFIPALTVIDSSRFKHRGLLLDCCRHFFSVDVVKKYIDMLALYKMNTLHWHLTEDQGWRIQIDKCPRLTEVGAWRTELDGSRYGGYYTKDEIREVVEYAADRHINVIPEIELPGHSQAAIASYPHLSCTGEQVEVANDWGVFKEIYCAGNDQTFEFLEDVLTEVLELFPSKYIHIGGDEAPKTRWEQCDKCQQRIKKEGLKDEHELQSYFIKRIQSFLRENGRELIGWDEILEGGLAEGAVVQSWRSTEGGIEAAKQGNYAIMSPTSHCYFDYSLDAIDMEKVYSFEPISDEMSVDEAKYVIGGECNMWTEHVPDERDLDSKVFPRMLAMAEVLWSDTIGRDYAEFKKRVHEHRSVLEAFNIDYGMETVPVNYVIDTKENSVNVSLEEKVDEIEVSWFIDDVKLQDRTSVAQISDHKPNKLTTIVGNKNGAWRDTISLTVHPHLSLNDPIDLVDGEFSEWYTAGGLNGLVDGVLGSRNFRDGRWQGYWGNDMECVIDLGDTRSDINSVSTNFYQYNNAWIFIPRKVSMSSSIDGENWQKWGTLLSEADPKRRGKFIKTFELENPGSELRFIKMSVENFGKVPEWHEAAGADAWIFIDEIIVK